MSKHPEELRDLVLAQFEFDYQRRRYAIKQFPGAFAHSLFVVLQTHRRARLAMGKSYDAAFNASSQVEYTVPVSGGKTIVASRQRTHEERDDLARQFVTQWDRDVRNARKIRPHGPILLPNERPKFYARKYLSPQGLKVRLALKGGQSPSARRKYAKEASEES